MNLKTKKQKSFKYADIISVGLDKRTLKITLKARNKPEDRNRGQWMIVTLQQQVRCTKYTETVFVAGGSSKSIASPAGVVLSYKAISDITASEIYSCIKQRIDRATSIAALEKQERTRATNQKVWVNYLNKCCDDVFDDVVASEAGKSIVEAEVGSTCWSARLCRRIISTSCGMCMVHGFRSKPSRPGKT